MSKPFVDRIEGTVAVVIVDGVEKRVAIAKLPAGVREGVILTDDMGAIDEAASKAEAAKVRALRSKLGRDDDGGDFSL